MDNDVALVLKGFEKLTKEQRAEFMRHIKGIEISGAMDESVRKTVISMGPTSKGCPCCGR